MTLANPHSHSLHHRRNPSASNASSKFRSATRPALHRKGTSLVNLSISKLGAGHARHSSDKHNVDDLNSDMSASFLNFCAMCERQITVPNNSLLYCSESCRRKDSCKPLAASAPTHTSMSASTTPPTSPPMSPRTIVPPMIPTRVPTKAIPIHRIPGDTHDARTDLDPTEWKPLIPRGDGNSPSMVSSEAWNYLSKFHGDEPVSPGRRASAYHRSSSSLSTFFSTQGTSPSLAHTPSTVASSLSSSSSDYMACMQDSTHRPLPPRHNPYFNSASATKGVDLVVPQMGGTPVVHVTSADMSDSGSIFPASSTIWGNDPEKTDIDICVGQS